VAAISNSRQGQAAPHSNSFSDGVEARPRSQPEIELPAL